MPVAGFHRVGCNREWGTEEGSQLMLDKELGSPVRRIRGVFYGWWLSGIAAFVMILGIAPLFHGMPAWNVVLDRKFEWSRAQLSLAFSLARMENTVMGPVGGFLVDRLGPRRMVLVGLLILGVGFLLFSQVHNLWQFYLAFVLMSMGMGLGTFLPMMTALNNWFIQRRSTAMAVAFDGLFIGAVILVPALTWAIDPDQPDRLGWRATAAVIGVFILLVAFPISRLVRDRPEDYGYQPDGRPADAEPVGSAQRDSHTSVQGSDYTWQQALRSRAFWLITAGHGFASVGLMTMTVHLGLMLDDRDFSLQTIGWVVSMYTAVGAVSAIVGGYIGDRIPIRLALGGFSILQGVSIFVILLADNLAMVFFFAVLFGAGTGGRIPLTTAVRGVYFGRRAFASILGLSMMPINVVTLGVPWFAGYMYDTTDSYNVPFIAVGVLSLVAAALFLMLGDPEPARRQDAWLEGQTRAQSV